MVRSTGFAWLFALLTPLLVSAAPSNLSQSDRSRLSRGEIVFKPELPSAQGTPIGNGGTAIALLEADVDAVWRILTDFEHYAGLFPRLTASEVMDREGARALVRFHIAVGPFNFRFSVAHVVSPQERQIRWRLDRSQAHGLFNDTWGYWQVDPLPAGRVLVTYAMGSQTVLPALLTRGSQREPVVKTVEALRARVEHGRSRPEDQETGKGGGHVDRSSAR